MVEECMGEMSKLTGREYHLFNYYGAADADRMIIAMGSVCDCVEETIDYLNAKGEKVGLLNVHLYRPFSLKHFFKYIPKTVKKIAVLDRTKEIGSIGEPLFLDVKNAFYGKENAPVIVGGRYGLGSKDVVPSHIAAVYENLKLDAPKADFTISIVDDVTNKSLPIGEDIDATPAGTKACKFWGLGSDGTVGANKSAIKIIGDKTNMYAQGYFFYDSKKSGGITVSHLRFGKSPIKSPYLINKADYVGCHNQSYVFKYDVLEGLKKGSTFLLNCVWTPEELDEKLPASMKKFFAENDIKFYIIDAVKIAQEIGLGGRINMIMQSAFFKLADVIPLDEALAYLKEEVVKSYGRKGQKIVDMNNAAIDKGVQSIVKIDIPASWKTAMEAEDTTVVPEFIKKIVIPMNRQAGDKLPVSAFLGMEDGTFPSGTAAYEKRGVAIEVPEWQADKCIQCNQCSYVCPHAAVRPALATDEEVANAPEGFVVKPATGAKGLNFRIAVSPLDCLGCGNCAQICPSKEKALIMKPLETQLDGAARWDYAVALPAKANPMNKNTVKGSQFEQPLFEFSGACSGCGETPYAKIVTQLFGDRMMIANATGCSSIWGASAPSMPYCKNQKGHGPAWANSLFEDNAEFGLGMYLGVRQLRDKLAMDIASVLNLDISEQLASCSVITAECSGTEMESLSISPELADAFRDWLSNKENGEGTRERADKIIGLLEAEKGTDVALNEIYKNKDFLVKRSQWIFGGDGWSYDIGYGGLDHVLASGEDVNVFVFDTEVYSNTGGQSSKATPTAAIAKFAASGKKTKKKDLGMMAMSYGYVYVAQVSMGADKNQTLKAIQEAEAYKGPSLIIAYAPCINHGIKAGMGTTQNEMKKAVDCGYWAMYRFNPILAEEGKNPFTLDSKEPTASFRDFLMGEVRYASLATQFPEAAEALFEKTEKDANERLTKYKKLASGDC